MFKELEPANVSHFRFKNDWKDQSIIKIMDEIQSTDRCSCDLTASSHPTLKYCVCFESTDWGNRHWCSRLILSSAGREGFDISKGQSLC